MAQIERRTGKKGVAYLITVNCGKDSNGKQIRHRKTFVPPQTWSEARQEKAALKEAVSFEEQIKNGYALDNRQTFAEYANYVIAIKRREGKKEGTLERYTELLARINPIIGHLKLSEIRPAHLNNLYERLAAEGLRKTGGTATAKIDLKAELKSKKLTQIKLAESSGVSTRTISKACTGAPIAADLAERLAIALESKPDVLFEIRTDNAPLSKKTILEHHRFISTVLGQAEKEMLVPYNAAAKASPPKPQKHDPNYFQSSTVHKILEAADTEPLRYRAFIYLCVTTGARRGELAGLKWKNVDLETGQIVIDHALLYSHKRGIYESTTKTGDVRYLKIPEEVISLLSQIRAEQNELMQINGDRWNSTGYIFTQDNGLPIHPQTWTGWMSDFSARHNLPHINPHAFRHTVASTLIASGTDVVTTSKILGHSSPSTTENFYSHLIESAKAAASNTLTDILIRGKKEKDTE